MKTRPGFYVLVQELIMKPNGVFVRYGFQKSFYFRFRFMAEVMYLICCIWRRRQRMRKEIGREILIVLAHAAVLERKLFYP